MAEQSAEPSRRFTKEETDRLWQYRIQEENVYYQRTNFFLIGQTMLFTAHATVIGAPCPAKFIIGGLGLLLAATWMYASKRQWYVYEHLTSTFVTKACPEYGLVRKHRRQRRWRFLKTWFMMTWVVPAAIASAWLALLIFC